MSVTETGLAEAKKAVDALPATLTAVLRGIAFQTASAIAMGYRSNLLSQTKARKTAASARVLDESKDKQYVVNVPGHPDDPAQLSGWLEYGTQRMVAKPSLRPAGDAEDQRYKDRMGAAAERTVREAVGG